MEDQTPSASSRPPAAGQFLETEAAQRVMAALQEIEPRWLDLLAGSPGRQSTLINFLAFSPGSLEKIQRRPELLRWLLSPDVTSSKDLLRDVASQTNLSDDQYFSRLRVWMSDEMLRIAFRDFSGQAGLVETTADITAVAERCVAT